MSAPLLPIVIPLILILNAVDGLTDVPEIVRTTAVMDVGLGFFRHTAARPETLLSPAATVGVTDGAKKSEG
jgi:hypothetical protein